VGHSGAALPLEVVVEHEMEQAAHMHKTFAEIIDAMGGKVQGTVQTDGAAIARGGQIIHEVGTVRMGSDPKNRCSTSSGRRGM
jgi:choline dehydrogenase-like flavoprotein